MKFIWAFDPQQNPKEALKIVKEIKFWARHLKADVYPVCVLAESLLDLPDKNQRSKIIRTETDKWVARHMRQLSVKGFMPPKILKSPAHSRRAKAKFLADYSQELRADYIFLNTHLKNSWNPFRLGGFAEALISLSDTSLVLMNPQTNPSQEISNIFFPTDFGRPSKTVLQKLVPVAKEFKAKFTLFNRIETTIYYLGNLGGLPPTSDASRLIAEVVQQRKKQAHKWQERLAQQNLESDSLLQKEKWTLSRDITAAAKRSNGDLIALVNVRQPRAERILGSTAKDVLVRAHCPVLVLRN